MKSHTIEAGKTYEVKSGKEARTVLRVGKDLPRPVWSGKTAIGEPTEGATPIVEYMTVRGSGTGKVGSMYLFQFANWAHTEIVA